MDMLEPTVTISSELTGPIPTPTYGPGGSFSVVCTAKINATPKACLDVILDASQYPTWNRFCRKCTIDAQPGPSEDGDMLLRLGTQFTFDVHMDPDGSPEGGSVGRATALEVSVLEPIDEIDEADGAQVHGGRRRRRGWRVGWKGRSSLLMPAWMLHNERIQEFVECDGDGAKATEYRCWETFYGVLAPVVRLAVGAKIVRGFEVWAEGLQRRVQG